MGIVKEALYDVGDEVRYEVTVDHSEALNENDDRKKDSSRGFSPDRLFQHIGSVPVHVWHQHCKKVGFQDMDKTKRKEEIIRFLNQFQGYATVEKIRTQEANETSIFIR